MLTTKIQAIILAAGRSSRFNTQATKLSFTLCGQEMIVYPVKLLQDMKIPTTLVVGYQKEVMYSILKKYSLNSVNTVEQHEAHGTGHAVLCTRSTWSADDILVINGDMPLVNQDTIHQLIKKHQANQATITFAIAYNSDTSLNYGRVVREQDRVSIIEAQDYTGDSGIDCYINAGIYIFKRAFLEKALPALQQNQLSKEIFLTDLVRVASEAHSTIETVLVDFDQVRGINTLKELWAAEHIKKSELITHWFSQGVRFTAPHTVHIDLPVIIGRDTTIGIGVQLRKNTVIGKNCFIDAYSTLENSTIGDNSTIFSHCVINDAHIAESAKIGPFAHVKNQSCLAAESTVGNFVEISHSFLGKQSKAKHLAYIGNAQIGDNVNIGAGTITCNYNGFTKQRTEIKNNAFIGSNCSLVAPVTIGDNAVIGAGSVITQDVPDDALSLSRSEQVTKESYSPKLKQKYKDKSIKSATLEIL